MGLVYTVHGHATKKATAKTPGVFSRCENITVDHIPLPVGFTTWPVLSAAW